MAASAMALSTHPALRVLSVHRGSSWPVVVQTPAGQFLTKLRGAAQGIAPLIAEIIVAEIATLLGLPVPERVLVTLDESVPSDDRRDELLELLGRSHGTNLGFRFLPGATIIRAVELDLVGADLGARIVWLDGFVMNPDRTAANPNILVWHRQPWLIDHGAALPFHYDWAKVTEDSPRQPLPSPENHLLISKSDRIAEVDLECVRVLTREALTTAVARVPEEFLVAAFPDDRAAQIRQAYVAFLWKRLKAPRPFLPLWYQ